MRLSDVLSKPIDLEFKQVEGFLDNRKLKEGKSKKLLIGKVALTYFCAKCDSDLSFVSKEDIFGIGVNNKQISVDCVLTCPRCGNQLPVWFLVESANEIHNIYPEVRVLKRTEKFNPTVQNARNIYGNFAELLGKAECAYRNELGAGAIIYLRKIYEKITKEAAQAAGIVTVNTEGQRKSFRKLLEEVDKQKHIIPAEFSNNGYQLFSELSEVAHGDNVCEEDALLKYEPFRRLVIGIIEKVKNDTELAEIKNKLGW